MDRVQLEQNFEDRRDNIIGAWQHFLAFKSISADNAYIDDCRACAAWLLDYLGRMGFTTELLESGAGRPVVYAERAGSPGRPVVLFYGHYDVQPVDPLELWKTPPFEPQLRDGRMYARGAQDNKGQVFYTLTAIESLLASGAELPTIKIVIEGEEEYGSTAISALLRQEDVRRKLAADVLLVHDTGTVRSGNPTITMGLRGMAHLSVELLGPDHDLHSGMHGGLAPNPAQGVAAMVASLFAADGSVQVAGFYDGVRPPTATELKLARREKFDEAVYERMVGCRPLGGRRGVDPVERVGFLPSLDVNGIHSGYGGDGMKTVLPARAIAKLSMRLVPDQNPADILEKVENHLRQNVPPGMKLRIEDRAAAGPGFRLDPESEFAAKARDALTELDSGEVAYLWEGASIPIVTALSEASGAVPLLVGFGHEDDHIHAPNESFSLDQFRSGFLYVGLLLQRM